MKNNLLFHVTTIVLGRKRAEKSILGTTHTLTVHNYSEPTIMSTPPYDLLTIYLSSPEEYQFMKSYN